MIPFIRSMSELMVITQPKDQINKNIEKKDLIDLKDDSCQKERYIKSRNKKLISLPNIPKLKRRKWIKSKEVLSKFFDELDYNNKIPSSYDLTLLERQNNIDKYDAA